jgi:hypothetical protein
LNSWMLLKKELKLDLVIFLKELLKEE